MSYSRTLRTLACCLPFAVACLLASPVALTPHAAAAPDDPPPMVIRPLPLAEGIRDSMNPGGDPKKLRGIDRYKQAKLRGIDLARPQKDPVVAHALKDGRLFYVFFKTLEEAFADRPYVIQRIKRTERIWATAESDPVETVTYQVEAFKLLGGTLKRADEHHGLYSIHDNHRREIVKEYEFGFGEVPGRCEGTEWPFARGRLFEYIAKYGPDREAYDAVEFQRSLPWTLTVSLDAEGGWVIRAPELGIDLPAHEVVDAARAEPTPDPASAGIVLVPGVGIEGVKKAADIGAVAGRVVEDAPAGKSNRNVSYAAKVIANVRADGSLNTLRTRAGFAGRTDKGIRVGDTRRRVVEVYGWPRRTYTDAAWWHYGDVGFWFDGNGRVGKMYVRGGK